VLHRLGRRAVLAASVVDAGQGLRFGSSRDPLPTKYSAGLAIHPARGLFLALDGVGGPGRKTYARAGIDWRAWPALALRAGFRTDRSEGDSGPSGFAAGLGLFLGGQEVSYAWVPSGRLGNAQHFSLLWRFREPNVETP
jgi:hypothetical protein